MSDSNARPGDEEEHKDITLRQRPILLSCY